MFETGKQYAVRLYADGEDRRIHGIIIAVDGTLIKLSSGSEGEMVINTASSVFVSATLLEEPENAFEWEAVTPPASLPGTY